MADAKTQNLRILKIKTGVVRRLLKDKSSYEKEASDQEKKIESFRQEGKDEYFMKQQVNSLKETQLMIPDVQRRLQVAYDDLKSVTSDGDEGVSESEEYKAAVQVLKEAEVMLGLDKEANTTAAVAATPSAPEEVQAN